MGTTVSKSFCFITMVLLLRCAGGLFP
jgi:hypothetical protein